MTFIIHFLLGFITSFLGTLSPSMLNMTAIKISLEKTKKEGTKFALGVSIIVFFQAYLAILLTKHIQNNDDFQWYIKIAGLVIFSILSVYFFLQAKREHKQKANIKYQIKNSLIIGLILSSLNMFAIPFYCAISGGLNIIGWLEFNQISIILFVIGSALGTYNLLCVYVRNATKIQSKVSLVTKNLNYALSILTAVVAIATLINFL